MRPVGLDDPRTGRWPHAVIQLRSENLEGTAWGLVGFQTRLRHGAQRELFRTLPGMAEAEFLRLGSIHRNTYLDAPASLDEQLRLLADPRVRIAGQLAGCEGYVESIALGLMAALWTVAEARGVQIPPPPPQTMLGGLLAYLRTDHGAPPSPMNVNFGLVPPVASREGRRKLGKRERRARMAELAVDGMRHYGATVLAAVG
jgi:methylenetetrahydrofolate--tRNA-(uracil-5-)-methyltransferase